MFGLTATLSRLINTLRPFRGPVRRALALEAMRSLVLAKKAMWELGLALHIEDDDIRRQLNAYDLQADRQADQLKALQRVAVREAFGTDE